MLGYVPLLLAALLPAGQTAITMVQPVVSITRQARKSAKIPCEFSQKSITYIHWYHQQPGKALQRLLYYHLDSSKQTMNAGFSSNKFYAYMSKDQSCTLEVQNLVMSDAGIYYCASWDSTVIQFYFLILHPALDSPHHTLPSKNFFKSLSVSFCILYLSPRLLKKPTVVYDGISLPLCHASSLSPPSTLHGQQAFSHNVIALQYTNHISPLASSPVKRKKPSLSAERIPW
ncbi:uncharacterized protein LOC119941239 [Tachyglossus aculeatus]|uniref:uncharacterized protein LOC119941239 n=1 Tax=Tachyglossus aculeatus TaxID=9261 RepID=UPI0018F50081|nr:uncharacterized protein LOC119941239 [Tachyglossus aculeatus]